MRICVMLLLTALLLPARCQAPRTWVFDATWSNDPGVTCVDDADALDGKALECPATDKTWGGWYTCTSGYTMDFLPGEYEVRYRLKVEDNTHPGQAFDLGVENGDVWVHPKWSDFQAAKQYQEFVYPFVIKTPVLNICTIRKYAGPRAWIDRITVVRKRLYTELEQLAFAKFERPENPQLIPHDGLRVWFVKGLYYQHYKIHTLLQQLGAAVDYAYVIRGQRGSALAGMPLEDKPPAKKAQATPDEEKDDLAPLPAGPYDTVLRRDLIVLCDADVECLTVPQRAMIQDFVKAGGGLLVVGGPFAFGRGGMGNSELLAPLLPVTTAGDYDLQPLPAPAPLLPAKGHLAKDGLAWNKRPLVLWLHQAQAKPGAMVELTAGGHPALVTWNYGKGRVAALTATVLGEAPAGGIACWDWADWPQLMATVVQWLLPRK